MLGWPPDDEEEKGVETPEQLQAYLRSSIPLGEAMGLRVDTCSDGEVRLAAPLLGNHNDKMTAFAGSLYSLASLAGWSLLQRLVSVRGLEMQVAIFTGEVAYMRPVRGDFSAHVRIGPEIAETLLSEVRTNRRGRVGLEIMVEDDEGVAMRLAARYALFPAAPA